MSLLEREEAKLLLADATLIASTVRACRQRLTGFVQRDLPCFYRREQREHAELVLRGKLSHLDRKTCEPIAREAGVARRPVQMFVGAGEWDDERVMSELRRHVTGVSRSRFHLGDRRQRVPEKGARVLRREAAMVRPVGKSRQLPSRRISVVCVRGACRTAGPAVVFASRLGQRHGSPPPVSCAAVGAFCREMATRAATDRTRARCPAWLGHGGRRVRPRE